MRRRRCAGTDYRCRDDYGGAAPRRCRRAGLHYFASRHGFHAPGEGADERDADMARRQCLARPPPAAPLGDRLQSSRVALRVRAGRHDASVDFNVAEQRLERWSAPQVVLAVPLFIAARLLEVPPAALVDVVGRMRYAPWLVANLHVEAALDDHPGAAPAWDNVRYRSPGLGYVDAMHQSLMPYAGATVLTAYWTLGGDSSSDLAAQRRHLLEAPWSTWADAVVQDLAVAHPISTGSCARRPDALCHAMSIPVPGLRGGAVTRTRRAAAARAVRAQRPVGLLGLRGSAVIQHARGSRSGPRLRDRASAVG
jgi:hypothetical protein